MSERGDMLLERQGDASEHDLFEELPSETTRAIEAAVEPPDNRFIPLRAIELLRALEQAGSPAGPAAGMLGPVFDGIREVIDQEARGFERELLERYHPFWPDADTARPDTLGSDEEERFLHAFAYLLEKANCERLTDAQLEHAIRTANTHGLRVDIDHSVVRHLEVYVRGRGTITKRFRSARAPVKGRAREIEVFKRLAIVVSFHDDDHVVLKLFRDIPLADLEALMPHARVRMNWFDRLKVFGGSAGALGGVATKIIGGAALGGALLWAMLLALFGFSLKGFFGYRNTIRQRVGKRTQHLYYQNLANNAGVITTLLHQVCQEELKEALLAYAFLLGGNVNSEPELDAQIEAWVRDRFGITVNFDCPDALETLDRLGLWSDRGRLRVLEPEAASRLLDEHWRERRSAHYHRERLSSSS
ncbi:MAG: hypothetical protein Tsb0013_06150 [Phycisphaerales bacterium]